LSLKHRISLGRHQEGFALANSPFPIPNVVGIKSDAEQIGWNKAKLCSPDTDQAKQRAVGSRDDPALPQFSPDHERGHNRQDAGNVIQRQHKRPIPEMNVLDVHPYGNIGMPRLPDNDSDATAGRRDAHPSSFSNGG
jgi:hypothetical protein